jgi:SNF2 family DNA or RNA helicase
MLSTRPKKRGASSKSFAPKKYQLAAVKFGLSRLYAGFFLAPGLGKTLVILLIFKVLKRLRIVDELMVMSKRRIIRNTWPKELRKWAKLGVLPDWTHVIVHGKDKGQALYEPADIRLINFDGVSWLIKQKKWFRRKARVMLCIDESSALRHTRTKRFKRLKKILHHFTRRYIMTGSPAPKGLMGIFGQVYALDFGKRLGKYITHFRNQYFYPSGYMGYEWKLQPGAEKRIFKRIKPLIIRYGEDELDLPPIKFMTKEIVLPPKARRLYDEMEEERLLLFKQGDVVAANAAVATQKLRQIANGAVYYSDKKDPKDRRWRGIHDEKLAALTDLLEELNGEPALVAYEFGHDKERIQSYFRQHAKQFADSPFIGGKAKDSDVDKYLRQWDKGKLLALFGQPDSIAHGLNLQEGRGGIVIFFALTWNFENYEQFWKRVHRQGQQRRVLCYRLVAKDTVDEDMVKCLRRDDHNQQSLLKAMERRHE